MIDEAGDSMFEQKVYRLRGHEMGGESENREQDLKITRGASCVLPLQ